MSHRTIHVIRASLNKEIYRDIEIVSDKSLYDLAKSIVAAFDFDFDHAFGFYSKLNGYYYDSPIKYELFADMGESDALSVKKTHIAQAFPSTKTKLLFVFDYGDEWTFKAECLAQADVTPRVKYPRVVKSAGKAPEQYPDPDDDMDD